MFIISIIFECFELFCLIDDAKLRQISAHSCKYLVFCPTSLRQVALFYDSEYLPLIICRIKVIKGYKSC